MANEIPDKVSREEAEAALESWVREAVDTVDVVDVHTHLFPPSHGPLMSWGIDALLTYHYLVAELFVAAANPPPEHEFFKLSSQNQADLIWEELFVRRSPISEACQGVLTTLRILGLHEEIRNRDLKAIRAWFAEQDPEVYTEHVFRTARVRYCVMTNIPFVDEEVEQWQNLNAAKSWSKRFKAAVRVDPILKGDWATIEASLRKQGFSPTIRGAREFLKSWSEKTDAIYFMASTPNNFAYSPTKFCGCEGAQQEDDDQGPCTSDVASELIDRVLVPTALELKFAIAVKIGACRGLNPKLNPCGGGDGVEVADLTPLATMCRQYTKLKILITVLSRDNQHELTVMANKFGRQLHVYGCWWYCNNPSIIDDVTRMRLEILGTAFTAQHSDARVLDQLLYKWTHSRRVISEVLVDKYRELYRTGWVLTQKEVNRDVGRLFGDAFEEFLAR